MKPLTREGLQSTLLSLISRDGTGGVRVIRTRYLMLLDIAGIVIALGLSLLIHDGPPFDIDVWHYWPWVLFCLAVRLAVYYRLGLYARMWRYASVQEVQRIITAVSLGSVIIAASDLVFSRLGAVYTLSLLALLLDWFFNLGFACASRLLLRVGLAWLSTHNKRVLSHLVPKRKVMVIGAGDVGSMITRMMQENPDMGYYPVCFVDDDPHKQGLHVHGLEVRGRRDDIPSLVEEFEIDDAFIAMPTTPQVEQDKIYQICSQAGVPVRVVPGLRALISGQLTVEQLRQWRPAEHIEPQRYSDNGNKKAPQPLVFHNVLVTGGAGFIGSNFVHHMLEAYPDYRIVVYDKLTYAGNLDNLRDLESYGGRFVFVRGDICDFSQVYAAITNYKVDAIVNFAAETHVDRSLMEPGGFLNTNVFGTYTLLEAARQLGGIRYHQVSTDEVYGQVIRGSFSEEDPLETRSPYSASKASADLIAHAYYVSFDVPVTITRGSNNIGPYQYPEKAVPLFVTNALDNIPLPVYGDGMYVRDYQYVLDHCRAIDVVLHRGELGKIYNVGGGNEVAALQLAINILDKLGRPRSLIQLVTDRAGQDRRYSLNSAKVKSLGWKPEYDFERALEQTINWYVENEWWWRKLKSSDYKKYYEKQYGERLETSKEYVFDD